MNYSGTVELENSEVAGHLIDYLELAVEARELLRALILVGKWPDAVDVMGALQAREIEKKRALLTHLRVTLNDKERAKLTEQLQLDRIDNPEYRGLIFEEWNALSHRWTEAVREEEVRRGEGPRPVLEELKNARLVIAVLLELINELIHLNGVYAAMQASKSAGPVLLKALTWHSRARPGY